MPKAIKKKKKASRLETGAAEILEQGNQAVALTEVKGVGAYRPQTALILHR